MNKKTIDIENTEVNYEEMETSKFKCKSCNSDKLYPNIDHTKNKISGYRCKKCKTINYPIRDKYSDINRIILESNAMESIFNEKENVKISKNSAKNPSKKQKKS